ncbi:hypothetical protein N7472_010396 [Penicillium cf. griseofulvum]|uniref:Uncharacterized protein n=1 Tax=Penicillium cf. griseofulvum TaxID=2972120 RepID=A0A9W9IXW1_9EURO|nr:hypothetical protein N7472_010396 [Penicillium cf. griseofulvum]
MKTVGPEGYCEVRLVTERRLKYIRTAKIQFDPPLPRDLDLKNLERLRGIFRKNRCRRLDIDNYIPTIGSFGVYTAVTVYRRYIVFCSYISILTINEDIGKELRASLVEEYTNQKKPTDREIYRKIRQYKGEDNEAFRERNRYLRRAFDRLLAVPGLWLNGIRISVLHRLIASGYSEDTVEALQLLAPSKSRTDIKTARRLVLGGYLESEEDYSELYTIRYYTLIPPDLKKEDDLLAKLSRAKLDQRAIYEIAELARRLGFKSTEIDRSRGRLYYRPENRISIDTTASNYLYAEVEVTDTITSFFVHRYYGLTLNRDQPMGDEPQSPLFIVEEEPSNSYKQTIYTALLSVPTLDR